MQTHNVSYLRSEYLTVEIPKTADYWSLVYGYRRFGEIFSEVIHSVMNVMNLCKTNVTPSTPRYTKPLFRYLVVFLKMRA